MKNKNNCDVIIVGAGLAGLSCAYELCAKGKTPLIIEKHPYSGGRTSSYNDNGMQVESGLHRYIGHYSALPKLLKKCGVNINDIVTWEEKVDILVKDENKKLVLGVAPLLGFKKAARGILENKDILTAKDKRSLISFFLCGFAGCAVPRRLDKYSVAEFARRHKVTPRSQRLVLEPLSSGIFFLPPEEYSALAFFGLFIPAIPKFYKMRIGAFLGGMTQTLCGPIEKKIRSLGGELIFEEPIQSVIIENGAVTGVRAKSGREYRAEHTVIAAPINAAKQILKPLEGRKELQRFFSLPTASACTVQLELSEPAMKKDITVFGPATDMVSFAEQSRTTFRESKGRLSVILGHPEKYVDKSLEQLLPLTLEQLSSLGVNLKDKVVNARKVSEKDEFYSLAKGSQRLRPKQKTAVPGLTLAGDYTKTSSFATMEGAVLSGKKAAKEVCRR